MPGLDPRQIMALLQTLGSGATGMAGIAGQVGTGLGQGLAQYMQPTSQASSGVGEPRGDANAGFGMGVANGLPGSISGFGYPGMPGYGGNISGMPATPGVATPTAPTAAQTNTGGGMGQQAPGGPPGTGTRPNAVTENPQAAVMRGLLAKGRNPAYDFSPYVQSTLKRANDLVNTGLANLARSGNVGVLGDDTSAQNWVTDLVGQSLAGGKVFGGATQDSLRALTSLAEHPEGNPGALVLAQLLSDPDRAASLAVSSLYGGNSDRLMRLFGAPIGVEAQKYEQGLEQGTVPDRANLNLLAYLLGLTGDSNTLGDQAFKRRQNDLSPYATGATPFQR